jgi:FkbM family methyltransferase
MSLKFWRRRPDSPPEAQTQFIAHLVQVLGRGEIDLVLDVGANRGQFAGQLRAGGYAGRIVSFEPLAATHTLLTEAAQGDINWQIAPAMALGAKDEDRPMLPFQRSDMNSLLPLAEAGREAFPRLEAEAAEIVSVRRLDGLFDQFAGPSERVFLKVDTQGFEKAVLEGASGCIARISGLQLEIAFTAIYVGQPGWLETMTLVSSFGFEPVLTSPGYFSKRTARQIDADTVFMRPES